MKRPGGWAGPEGVGGRGQFSYDEEWSNDSFNDRPSTFVVAVGRGSRRRPPVDEFQSFFQRPPDANVVVDDDAGGGGAPLTEFRPSFALTPGPHQNRIFFIQSR